jgi:DNA-binding Xre family transcriptional regulator
MIQNERQYQVTKERLAEMESSYVQAQTILEQQTDIPAVIAQAQMNGIGFLISDLKAELIEYESLRAGKIRSLSLNSVLQDLPATLIRARIVRGWTHKDLAQALGTSEQQVQKDEAGGYAKASLEKLNRVAQTLDVSLTGRAKLGRRTTHSS